MSVSQARCLLKGASGQAPRWVVVALIRGDGIGIVSFCSGRSTTEGCRGTERVRQVAINTKRGRLCDIIVDER